MLWWIVLIALILLLVMREMARKDFISEMLGDTNDPEMRVFLEEIFADGFAMMEEPDIPMYVLTNVYLTNGAASLFYPEVKEKIAEELQGNYYVLPSSVHETLIIPDNGNLDYLELKDMVNQVNCTNVADTDILTGEVYFYDKEEKSLIIAGRNKEKARDKREVSIKEMQRWEIARNVH